MDITQSTQNDILIVHISGSMDALTAPKLTEYLMGQIDGGKNNLIGDLENLEYTSSAGLRALLGAVKAARQIGGDFRLAAIQPKVLKVLELSGFTNIIKNFDDVDTAVTSFS